MNTPDEIPTPPEGRAGAAQRGALLGQRPLTVWLTGLSGAGKSTLALALQHRLLVLGRPCGLLDGEAFRRGVSRDVGFSPIERAENIRRAAEVARLMNDAGLIALAAFTAPRRSQRALAKSIVGTARFVEVYVSTPLAVCEARDPKGLYRRAHNGELTNFAGVDEPYEPPTSPSFVIDTSARDRANCVDFLFSALVPLIAPSMRRVS